MLKHPGHLYTKGLLASLPDNGLKTIPGSSPSLVDLPAGCKFHPCYGLLVRDGPAPLTRLNSAVGGGGCGIGRTFEGPKVLLT